MAIGELCRTLCALPCLHTYGVFRLRTEQDTTWRHTYTRRHSRPYKYTLAFNAATISRHNNSKIIRKEWSGTNGFKPLKVSVAAYTTLTLINSTFCPQTVFKCFVWISQQTATISLYNINWLVCITETECVYCAVRTGSLNVTWVICFIWIWEQTAIISLYSINWLVFITETECVYCVVRAGFKP